MTETQSTTMTELYLHHGWGFDAACWRSWLATAPSDWIWTVADRGYTGDPFDIPSFVKPQAMHVAVAHSFGLHMLPEAVLNQCDLLVIISSFRQFDPSARRSLTRMAARLELDPHNLFSDFYAKCFGGASAPPPPAKFNIELLQSDLSRLEKSYLDLAPLRSIPKVLILHGENDTIVHQQQAALLSQHLPNSVLHFHKDAAHALPFTHPEWCLRLMSETLKISGRRLIVSAEERK